MKIVSLRAENIKRLVAVEIKPDGNLVEITGNNGNGKTSVLDAIWWALAGLGNVQSEPIRRGEERAVIRLDLGEMIVTRTFVKNDEGETTSQLKVESADGSKKFNSPQTMLDELLGAIAFDPLLFSRMAPKDQFEELKPFVKGFDFDKAVADHESDYQERGGVNKKAKEARALETQYADAPLEEPENPDTKGLTDQLADASKINTSIQAEQGARDAIRRRDVDEAQQKAKSARERAESGMKLHKESQARLEAVAQEAYAKNIKEAEDLEALAVNTEKSLAAMVPLGTPVDVDSVKKKLDESTAKQQKHDLWKKRKEARETAEKLEAESKAITERMEKREADKVAAVAASQLPVEGMSLGDGIVTFKGLPFDQASDAEKLMASVGIAMANNPKLKVIRIRDGSLLDTKAMELLSKVAEEKGYQVWVERVDGSGKVGFVIEDGRLKETAK